MKMGRFRHGLGLLIFLAVFSVATVIVMLLWNSVAVYLFNVPEVNFWYSAGLILLSKLLLGGFKGGFHGHRGGGKHRCHHGHSGPKGFNRRGGSGPRGGVRAGVCENSGFDNHMDMIREMHDRFYAMGDDERREKIRRHMEMFFGSESRCTTPPEQGAGSNGAQDNTGTGE